VTRQDGCLEHLLEDGAKTMLAAIKIIDELNAEVASLRGFLRAIEETPCAKGHGYLALRALSVSKWED